MKIIDQNDKNFIIQQLHCDITAAINFFAHHLPRDCLPFIHSFPKNCCEITSAILAAALSIKYPTETVLVIKGENISNNYHFWIKINILIIDLTAHQFQGHRGPILCENYNPLEIEFTNTNQISVEVALEQLDIISDRQKSDLINALVLQLYSHK